MAYSVEFSKHARRQLHQLSRETQERMRDHIDALAVMPRPAGVVKLSGENNTYRIRVGEYRVLYEIRDDVLVVLVIRIGHRRDVYKS
ncbi:MAG TPA: type II toxin-antitoxin system RelE/ParE family toxin [Candidatus Hydrogenedentes bacterium]|nr:type II toxin-antitoxin system RelE/ParE family toxin [Candidatus Hydrogenedentota bacterium]